MRLKIIIPSKIKMFAWTVTFLLLVILQVSEENPNDGDPSNIGRKLQGLSDYDYCFNADMEITVDPDIYGRTVTVSFQLIDSAFKDCFKYYDVYLDVFNKIMKKEQVAYEYGKNKAGSHVFEDVPCGIYQIIMQPCYNKTDCMKVCFISDAINTKSPYLGASYCITDEMYSSLNDTDCIGVKRKAIIGKSAPPVKTEIVIMSVFFVISIAVVCGFVYFCCCSVEWRLKTSRFFNKGCAKNLHVYILHYYDDSDKIKKKVAVLKDFLLLLPYCSKVTVIETDLHSILCNVDTWLDEALQKEDKEGNLNKIIIVDSQEDNQEDEYEMENVIFSRFISKLSDILHRHLPGYEKLFVVQFRGITPDYKRFKNVARLQKYFIPNCLSKLCLNLCVGCELNNSEVKKDLKIFLLEHPIGNLDDVQSV